MPVTHGHRLVLVLGTFMDVLAQHSVCGDLDVRIAVAPLGHNVDEKSLQVITC